MALNVGTLTAYLTLDDKKFTSGVQAADKGWQGLGGTLGGVGRTIAGASAAAVAATAAVGAGLAGSLVKTGVAYNNLEQTSRAAMTTILGSASAAEEMMGKISAFGKTSPFPRQAFIEATQQLLGFGFSADAIIPTLTAINDATAALGGNSQTIATMTDVFAKIQSQGKITGEEINRMGAVGIDAVGMLATAAGVSGESIRKSISEGSVDAATAISVLTDGMNAKFGGASENVKNTWGGAVDRVKGAWRDLASALVEPFISKSGGGYAVEWANLLADKLRVLEKQAPQFVLALQNGLQGLLDLVVKGDFTGQFREAFGVEEDSPVVAFLLGMRDAVIAVAAGFQGADFSNAGVAFRQIGSSLTELQPAFRAFGDALPSTAVVLKVVATTISQLADIAGFLAQHMKLLLAAFVAWRIGLAAAAATVSILRIQQLLMTATTVKGMAVTQAQTRAFQAQTIAMHQMIAAQRGVTLATVQAEAAAAADAAGQKKSLAARAAARVGALAMAAATAVATAAQWAFNAALSVPLLPLLAIAAGIAVVVAGFILLWKHSDGFRGFWVGAWDAIKGAVVGVWDWLSGTLWPGMVNLYHAIADAGFLGTVQAAWQGIRDAAGAVWDWLTGTLLPGITGVWDAVAGGVTGAFAGVRAALGTAIDAVLGFVRQHWQTIVTVVSGPLALLVGVVASHWGAVTGAFSAAWGAIWGVLQAIGSGVKTIWDGWVFPVLDLMGAVVTWLATTVWGALAGAVQAAWDGIVSAATTAWDWLYGNVLQPLATFVRDTLVTAWTLYRDAVVKVWEVVSGAVRDAWNWLRDNVLQPVIDFVVTTLVGAFTIYRDAVIKVWETVKGAVSDAWNWLRDTVFLPLGAFLTMVVVGYWTAVRDGAVTAWNGVKQPVLDAWNWIVQNV